MIGRRPPTSPLVLLATLSITASSSGCGVSLPGAPISGRAMLQGAADHAGTVITLTHGDSRVETDGYGYFVLPNVPRGEYMLTASRDATIERQISVTVSHDGKNPSQVFLELSPWGRAEGRVVTEDGQPASFATVSVLGRDISTPTLEDGTYRLDAIPAGPIILAASKPGLMAGTQEAVIPVGDTATVDLTLGGRQENLSGRNHSPTVGAIDLSSEPALGVFPLLVPIGSGDAGGVRAGGRYLLTARASDPDGDDISVFWSADRGTLESTLGELQPDTSDVYGAYWRAGPGISTLRCTVVDALGREATTRLQVEAVGDSIRGAGRHGEWIYYGERRSGSFDIYRFNLTTGEEDTVVDDALEQHAVSIQGDWLVWADSEFVFVGPLVYRIKARNLAAADATPDVVFGQNFGHDDTFVIRLDVYTPLASRFVPYTSNDANIAPVGYGYLDLSLGTPPVASPFSGVAFPPANYRSFARDGIREAWISGDSRLWTRQGSAPTAVPIGGLSTPNPADVQLSGSVVAFLPESGGPLYWLDLSGPGTVNDLGTSVTSFALRDGLIAYVNQGPSWSDVEIYSVLGNGRHTVTTTPHVARRILHLDNEYVIWGEQGVEGQTFVGLNTSSIWVEPLPEL